MQLKIFRTVSIILSVVLMIVIFLLSAQDAKKSSKTSSNCIKKTAEIVYDDFKKMSDEEKETFISDMQFSVRKAAHFTIFTALGICVMAAVITYGNLRIYIRALMGLIICALYAASDEIHQHFVPGRSCEFRDFCIDFIGSALGIGLVLLIFILIKKRFFKCLRKS